MRKLLMMILGMCLVFLAALFLNKNVDTFAFGKKEQIIRVESFSIEGNDSNLVEEKGYKNINSLSEIIENKREVITKVSVIEDHYDENGAYIKTIVKVEKSTLNLKSGKSTEKVREQEFQQPLALFAYRNTITILTDEEKEQIVNQVKTLVKKLPKS